MGKPADHLGAAYPAEKSALRGACLRHRWEGLFRYLPDRAFHALMDEALYLHLAHCSLLPYACQCGDVIFGCGSQSPSTIGPWARRKPDRGSLRCVILSPVQASAQYSIRTPKLQQIEGPADRCISDCFGNTFQSAVQRRKTLHYAVSVDLSFLSRSEQQ